MKAARPYQFVAGDILLPRDFEVLYDLKCAYRLIPIQYEALRKFLSRHKSQFPARYRRSKGGGRIRLLYASEIRRIRAMVIIEGRPIKRSVIRGLLDTSSPTPGSLP